MATASDDLKQLGLQDARTADRPITYLKEVAARREYIWYTAQSELRSRQMNTALGNLWHLLNPALQIGVYFLVFGAILGVDRGIDNFLAYLTIGVFMFGFTQRSTMAGARSIVANRSLMSSIAFPRALLPISSTLTEILATIPMLFVTIVVAIVTGETPSWRWVVLIPLFGFHCLFNAGTAMLAARATSHLRDIQQILPFVFRLLFYGSGVIFSVEHFITNDTQQWFFTLNPIYDFLTVARWSFLGGDLAIRVVVAIPVFTIISLVGGFIWFRRGEETYGAG